MFPRFCANDKKNIYKYKEYGGSRSEGNRGQCTARSVGRHSCFESDLTLKSLTWGMKWFNVNFRTIVGNFSCSQISGILQTKCKSLIKLLL